MGKKIYTGFSFWGFISILILKVLVVIAAVYAIAHYEENPRVISIVVFFCLLFILILGTDQIIVYTDKVTQRTDSFLDLILKSRGNSYLISDIKSAYLQPPSSPSEVGVAILLNASLPGRRTGKKSSQIFFDLKNGKTVYLLTDLEQSKIEKIVELVNSMTR